MLFCVTNPLYLKNCKRQNFFSSDLPKHKGKTSLQGLVFSYAVSGAGGQRSPLRESGEALPAAAGIYPSVTCGDSSP